MCMRFGLSCFTEYGNMIDDHSPLKPSSDFLQNGCVLELMPDERELFVIV
jgi:hypothetical protein